MRQIWIPKTGEPEVLEVREAPDPEPLSGEVRVRVRASGINFADVLARMGLYPDAPPLPRAGQLRAWIDDPQIDAVIATGGTGVTGRDVTPEAFQSVYDKEIDGFGELFRMISFAKIKTSTMQSRATGGVAKGTYLFALPGSPGACRDGWDEILVHQLDIRTRPCNLVELMPRLNER